MTNKRSPEAKTNTLRLKARRAALAKLEHRPHLGISTEIQQSINRGQLQL